MAVLSVLTDGKHVSVINVSAGSSRIEMLKALIKDLQHLDLLHSVCGDQGELTAAARWSITQDPSPGYRSVLVDALRVLGVDDADLGD